jgi:hypothetical protein
VEGSGVSVSATAKPAAALLLDADNLPQELADKAIADLRGRGFAVILLRAYGSPETLSAVRDVLQKHAARAIVNQGKGTTDATLVVDAMDLLHAGHLPPAVAIGSSDGDFAPLVVRLRESGRHVLCYAQEHKADLTALQRVYAEVILLGGQTSPRAETPSAATTPAPRARKAAKRTAAPAAKAPAVDAASEVWSRLEELPQFREGEAVELNTVVKKLRDAKLMTKSASATAFFKKLGLPVELTPARQPNKLRRLD